MLRPRRGSSIARLLVMRIIVQIAGRPLPFEKLLGEGLDIQIVDRVERGDDALVLGDLSRLRGRER